MKNLLLLNVRLAFSDIVRKYNLRVKEVDQNCVVLISESFGIGILLDRDGLAFMYYDLRGQMKKGYNLGLFLIQKRRDQLTFASDDKSDKPLDEYLSHNLAVFSNHLMNAGQDILSGDKGWIRQYSWPSTSVCDEVLAVV